MDNLTNASIGAPVRDPAISSIRAIAFLSIIACHIMQYYNCELAWWFNVGVQVFLCLSGYLYGKKTITDRLAFYKKQFIKILVPYYVVITLVIIAQLLFAKEEISIVRIANAVLCHGTLSGGEHLWYIPTILFCYVLTPWFYELNNRIFEKKRPALHFLISFVVLSVVVKLFIPYFNPAWISCFYLGHFLGKNESVRRINRNMCKGVIYFAAACLISLQIVIQYVLNMKLTGTIGTLFNTMCNYGRAFLGTSLVLILLDVFRALSIPHPIMKVVAFLDSISYEGYLVHQFFIFKAFSLLTVIEQPIIAIAVLLALTAACGLFVKKLQIKIKQFIKF